MTTEHPGHETNAGGHHHEMAPILPGKRIAAVDVLRGVAILIIVTGNVYYYSHPSVTDYDGYLECFGIDPSTRVADRTAYAALDVLFQWTIYPLYAFLFGFGAALLMIRAEGSDASFGRLYLRRLLALFAIGLCHVVFLWSGDILIAYSLTGLVLLPFRKRSNRSVVTWAGIFLLVWVVAFTGPVLLLTLAGTGEKKATTPPEAVSTAPVAAAHGPATTTKTATTRRCLKTEVENLVRRSTGIYARGTYGEILVRRIKDYIIWTLMIGYFEYPMIMGMMLLGLYVGRRGILSDIPGHLGLIRNVAAWGFALALAGNLAALVVKEMASPDQLSWLWVVFTLSRALSAPPLTLFYLSAVVLLLQKDLWQKRLKPFVNVGRMSLSNYLLQSLVCTLIFNGYGLGLYGKVGPALGVLLGIGIFVIQVPLSGFWMRRSRFGPVEWLWRTLTYLKPQPMRLDKAPGNAGKD